MKFRRSNDLWFPLILILVQVLTWVIQFHHYGFYLDDWLYLSAYDQAGFSGLLQYSINDSRPGLLAWVIGLGFQLFGNERIWWQGWSLFWRFQAGLSAWLLIRTLWPSKKNIAAFTSILLMIFPFFKHQALSIAYNMQWIQSALILYSFWLTALAIHARKSGRKMLLTALAVLLSGLQLFMTEYFLSLETLRILVILLAVRPERISRKAVAVRTIREYIPYAGLLLTFIVLRFIVMPGYLEDRNTLSWMKESGSVLGLMLHLLQLLIEYLSESIFGVWYRSLDPSQIDLTRLNDLAALGMSVLVALILGVIFLRVVRWDSDSSEFERTDRIFGFGICAMLLGFLPGMAVDKSPSTPFIYHDRFLIPSFLGISLALVSFIEWQIHGKRLKTLILTGFCMISVFFQVKNSIYYRSAWETQQNFQWQLKWRVPDLKENTLIAGDEIIASFMGGWADGAMVLEMYGKQHGVNPTPYWYLVFGEGDFEQNLENKEAITYINKIYDFKALHGDILVVTKPEWDRCLWVLDELDEANPYIQPHTKNLIQYQNGTRILYETDYKLPQGIFGKDYRHDWCYYFENADRYFALGQFQEVLALYQQAQDQGQTLKNPVEMTPFIRAAAISGDWKLAAEMTLLASDDPKITWEYFKAVWDQILAETADSPERAAALKLVQPGITFLE